MRHCQSLVNHLVLLCALSALLMSAGCATVDQKVNLGYAPFDRSFGRHSGTIVVSRIDPARPAPRSEKGEWLIGSLNNVHGVRQADITSDRNLAEWTTDALILELKQAGYTVTQAQAMPSATPRGLIISDIESFTNVNSGVVTDELKHELRFTVTLIKNGDKVKTFGVASRDNRLLPLRVSKAEQEKILLLSLQDAMKQVIPEIITFMSQT